MLPIFDATMFLLIPALLFALWAQMRVKVSFARYSEVGTVKGLSADSVARTLLDSLGLQNVRIERVRGQLTDHYDPRTKVLRLSDSVGDSSSIAAIGVAAHEVGHAVQDKNDYAPMRFRNGCVPAANIGSTMAFPLFFIGLLMRSDMLLNAGILLFSAVLIFHLVTLPVEFDASSRALKLLSSAGVLNPVELTGAKSVLKAAAWTYVATTLMAALQLVRLLILARGRRN